MNKKQIIELILASSLAIIIAILIRVIFFDTYMVKSNSMEPTFYENDAILLIRKIFIIGGINNFDIIVFKKNNSNLVKRVIAKEKDEIKIYDGKLYLNNKLIEYNKYIFSKKENIHLTLKENEYFVLGDNIYDSKDSREFGVIHKNDIIGKVILIFNPKNRLKLLFNN